MTDIIAIGTLKATATQIEEDKFKITAPGLAVTVELTGGLPSDMGYNDLDDWQKECNHWTVKIETSDTSAEFGYFTGPTVPVSDDLALGALVCLVEEFITAGDDNVRIVARNYENQMGEAPDLGVALDMAANFGKLWELGLRLGAAELLLELLGDYR